MTEPRDRKLRAYLDKADSWATDRQAELHASRRVAWIVAAAATGVAVLEALALVLLTPLKRVEPYTLMVDRQTGYVQLLKPLDPQTVSSRAALTQSFLVQYVVAREGFDIDAVQADYRKVAAWSAGPARAAYLALMPASNPASPLARLPRSSVVDVAVKSVSPLGPGTAMVRFDTVRHDAGQQPGLAQPWVAVVRYQYVDKPLSVADRFVNPLGFQVTRYNRSPEALSPPSAPTSAPIAPPQPATALPSTSSGGRHDPSRNADPFRHYRP